jgi:signal transduction histidine kinase
MAKWFSLALSVWFAICVFYWFGIGHAWMGIVLSACLSALIFGLFLLSSGYDLVGRVIIGMFGNLAVFTTSLVTHSAGYLNFNSILAILFAFQVFSIRYERPYFIAFVTAPLISVIFTSAFGNGRLVPLLVDQELASQVAAPMTLVSVLVGVMASLYGFYQLSEKRELELLFDAEKAKTEGEVRARFLANVTHEIRTPISSVLGLAGMLEEEEKNPSRQRMARNIVDVSNSILTIVNDLLDSAKLDAGKLEVNLHSEKVLDIFEGVFNSIRINAHSVNVSVYFDYDCDLPESIDTDSVRLRQILLNLLSNAIKFSKKSATGRKGEVHVLACRSSNDQLVIEVSDNGIGMSETQQSRLFKPFGQADATISQVFGGTGLGLSIAKALVEAMQGTISVRSRLNEGSTFKVQLPIRNPVFRTSDFQSPPSSCLFYSSSPQFAGLVRRYLEVVGSTVRQTHELSELMGLAALSDWPVILADFGNEEVQDIAVQLRQRYPKRQIIGMSSDPSVE